MARYSMVALYHKAKNATHNANRLKSSPLKKNIVQIPEARHAPDLAEALQHGPDAQEPLLTAAAKAGEAETVKKEKSVSKASPKKMPGKAAAVSKMKKPAKQAAASKTKKPAAKPAAKKVAKKATATPKAAKPAAKKTMQKAVPAKKAMTKNNMAKKMAAPWRGKKAPAKANARRKSKQA